MFCFVCLSHLSIKKTLSGTGSACPGVPFCNPLGPLSPPCYNIPKMMDGTGSHSSTLEIRELLSFFFSPSGRSPLWFLSAWAHFLLSAVAHSKHTEACADTKGSELTVPRPQAAVEDGREQGQPQVGLFPSVTFSSDNTVDFMS